MDHRPHRRYNTALTGRGKKRTKLRRRLVLERLTDRRVLAAITGTVFGDIDHSYRQEAGEQSLPDRLVYVDVNQNASIDTGEPFALTDDAGGFAFTGLPDGEYQIRLYDGSTSQTQVTPVAATRDGSPIMVASGFDLTTSGTDVAVLAESTLTIGNYSDGTATSLVIGNSPVAAEQLPSGDYLVVGGDGSSDSAWLVDPTTSALTPIDLSGDGTSIVWSDLAIDENGRGLLLQQTDDATLVRRVDASDADAGVVVTDNGYMFPTDAQVLASLKGNRSVVAWGGQWTDEFGTQSGLELSLWSNATGSPITYLPTRLADVTELVDYDDVSGLLALRTADGGVSLYDANADFALLVSLPEVTGPVAIDGERDLLVTMSASASTLKLIDAYDGQSVAELALNVDDIGEIGSIRVQESDSLVLLGNKGTSRVSLVKPAANHVTLVGGSDSEPIAFGVTTQGDNELPAFNPPPSYSIDEDSVLYAPTPGPMQNASDPDDDHLVLLPVGTPSQGTAIVTVHGDIQYSPDLNFNGVDTLPVILHDGRGASEVVSIQVDVNPVDDPPVIALQVDQIAENIPVGTVLGPVVIIDPDVGQVNELDVDDPRFVVEDGQLVFVGPGIINFEEEPSIEITIYDSQYTTSATYTVPVADQNDPTAYIEPDFAQVEENRFDQIVADLFIYDEDIDEVRTITVDDDRFIVVGEQLLLAPGVSLDFEATPTVTVNVTVTGPEDSKTEPILINVVDEIERASEVTLSNYTVLELSPGELVGDLIVDGNLFGSGYTATVDDSRFEIDGSTLKLVDDQWVDRADQEEIQLTVNVQDVGGVFDSISQTLIIQVEENSTPFHNDSNPFDVDASGEVSPLDALIIINYINENGVGEITNVEPRFNFDVNGDGVVSPLDILLVLNELDAIRQQQNNTVGGEEPSGELIVPSDQIADTTPSEDDNLNEDAAEDLLPKQRSRIAFKGTQQDTLPSQNRAIASDDLQEQVEMADADFADGVDASLDSLLDEMS
ncbi:dockerin type I domain-containing protein [Planctomycetes bacterium K23_9]|uniref:Dockerin type I repeat protein n=1 Tax=Stieleria marina TaxID=1930275 RepID=A0A517NQH1_9BACT|nr:Dockerin type I repeat protein [Planctomycetes bacterium K23_9]